MKVLYEFETPKAFGNIPAFYLTLLKGRKYYYLEHIRNVSDAPATKVKITKEEAERLLKTKCVGEAVDLLTEKIAYKCF